MIKGESEKVFVTKTNGDKYYFRCFGRKIGNTPGDSATIGLNQGNLVLDNDETLKVGDYAEITYYENSWSDFGFHCRKITPTEEDIRENELYQEYLNEIAKNAGAFFEDILMYSKEKMQEEGPTENDLVYGDIKIQNLVKRLVKSILTYGLNSNRGKGLFWFYCQLSQNNLFDSFVNYAKELGLKTVFYDYDNPASCVLKKYSDAIEVSISANAWDEWNPQMFEINYGDHSFRVKKLEDRIDVEPYVSGDFKVAMQETVDYSNSKN